MSVSRVEALIEQEETECAKRVWEKVKPLIQAEFNRLHKRFPSFERIMFGNGTHFFEFEKGSRFDDRNVQLPKAFERLDQMCALVQWKYAGDDIRPDSQT